MEQITPEVINKTVITTSYLKDKMIWQCLCQQGCGTQSNKTRICSGQESDILSSDRYAYSPEGMSGRKYNSKLKSCIFISFTS